MNNNFVANFRLFTWRGRWRTRLLMSCVPFLKGHSATRSLGRASLWPASAWLSKFGKVSLNGNCSSIIVLLYIFVHFFVDACDTLSLGSAKNFLDVELQRMVRSNARMRLIRNKKPSAAPPATPPTRPLATSPDRTPRQWKSNPATKWLIYRVQLDSDVIGQCIVYSWMQMPFPAFPLYIFPYFSYLIWITNETVTCDHRTNELL